MAFLFGKKKANAGPDPQQVLQMIADQIRTSDKRQEHLESQVEKLRQEAKTWAKRKQRAQAKQVLRRAKTIEARVVKLGAMTENLRTIEATIQDSFALGDYVKTLKVADQVLANGVTVEDVAELRDTVEEHLAEQQELIDLLATPIGPVGDDTEAEWDLNALLAEPDEEEVVPQRTAVAATAEDNLAGQMAGHG
jgi:DNA repair exonuclease SbcCD ATPase subunit